jgi:hypothetical protein
MLTPSPQKQSPILQLLETAALGFSLSPIGAFFPLQKFAIENLLNALKEM